MAVKLKGKFYAYYEVSIVSDYCLPETWIKFSG